MMKKITLPPLLCNNFIYSCRQFLFWTSKSQLKATVYALVFTSNLQIHIVTCCIYLRIHITSRIPYLFHGFSDFVVYVVTTLFFPKNQRQCAKFSRNVAILFLNSIPFSRFLRLHCLCIVTTLFFPKNSDAMCQIFDKRGYPISVVQAGHHRAQQINRQ